MSNDLTKDPVAVSSAIAPIMAIVPKSIADMTDEEWVEHDARVAADIANRQSSGLAKRKADELAKAGFPRRAIDKLDNIERSRALIARMTTWDPKVENVLVMAGTRGSGKTVAATWWASRRDHVPTFVRASTFAASSRYDRDERSTWLAAGALVMDDLGAEYLDAKGSFIVDLDELIDVFYGDRKPLLITTNCTKDAFRERYGARIVDRIRECGSWFSTSDESMRGRGRP
jgi:DNA replication protein DnaC